MESLRYLVDPRTFSGAFRAVGDEVAKRIGRRRANGDLEEYRLSFDRSAYQKKVRGTPRNPNTFTKLQAGE
jgi:hypothetical protein